MNNYGPISYENWKATERGEEVQYCFEYPLFTDAHVTGEITDGYGPYQFLNTVPVFKSQLIAPAIILRIEEHLKNDPTRKEMIRTDTTVYHGGWLVDEIAALLSLNLGMRLKAGGATRRFEANGDPRGRPEMYSLHQDPVFIRNPAFRPVIPNAVDSHCVNDAQILQSYPKLSPIDAVALVKAARLYQDALWISEFQPALSWIFFVSAIETSANHWSQQKESPLDRLRSFKPELEQLLDGYSSELPEKVAILIADYMGSTRKFLNFTIHFLPDAPTQRPPKPFQTSWEINEIEKSLRKIYNWRSKALHGGTPFPEPMCNPPFQQNDACFEKPIGLASQTKGGTWVASDTPMCLHIFEYIVRHSLLNWWDSMLNKD